MQPVVDNLLVIDLHRQRDALMAKGSAALAAGYLGLEMTDFVSSYLRALTYDFDEAVSSESKERKALLPAILSELHELVYDMQRRVEQAKGTLPTDLLLTPRACC